MIIFFLDRLVVSCSTSFLTSKYTNLPVACSLDTSSQNVANFSILVVTYAESIENKNKQDDAVCVRRQYWYIILISLHISYQLWALRALRTNLSPFQLRAQLNQFWRHSASLRPVHEPKLFIYGQNLLVVIVGSPRFDNHSFVCTRIFRARLNCNFLTTEDKLPQG